MFYPSTLDLVRAHDEEAFRVAILTLRKGRSKWRKEPLESFAWGFEHGLEVDSLQIGDLVSGKTYEKDREFARLTLEQKVTDYERRSSVWITGKIGNRIVVASRVTLTVPATILDAYRRRLRGEVRCTSAP